MAIVMCLCRAGVIGAVILPKKGEDHSADDFCLKFLVEQIAHCCYTTPTKSEAGVAQFTTLYQQPLRS
jgi:hypothetical protein